MSPSLLSTRLSELEHAGIVKREKLSTPNRYRYELTDAGHQLTDIVDQLAVWGQRWARDNEMDDFDLAFLAWSMHLRLNTDAMPKGRTVMQFEFTGAPTDFRCFWLVNTNSKVDMCLKSPGFEVDLFIKSDLRLFIEAWRGFRDLRTEIRASRIQLSGPAKLKKAFPAWLQLSSLAPVKRLNGGREQKLTESRRSSSLP